MMHALPLERCEGEASRDSEARQARQARDEGGEGEGEGEGEGKGKVAHGVNGGRKWEEVRGNDGSELRNVAAGRALGQRKQSPC